MRLRSVASLSTLACARASSARDRPSWSVRTRRIRSSLRGWVLVWLRGRPAPPPDHPHQPYPTTPVSTATEASGGTRTEDRRGGAEGDRHARARWLARL